MARVSLDLENKEDLKVLQAEGWRIAPGLVPGEPNQGLVAERRGSPPRLADFDDSGWALGDIQERRSVGFTFAWYRLRFTMPETVKGQAIGLDMTMRFHDFGAPVSISLPPPSRTVDLTKIASQGISARAGGKRPVAAVCAE